MPNSSSLFSLLTVLGAFVGQVSLAQDQPLSVIDWVQQHPNQPPITSVGLPNPLEPPVAPTAVIPQVEVAPLAQDAVRIIGLVPATVTGLPQDLWRGSDPRSLSMQVANLTDFGLPAAQALMYTLLLTEALGPGTDAQEEDLFTLARVNALLRFGALDAAMALIEQADVTRDVAHFSTYLDIALLTGAEDTACATLAQNRHLAPSYAHMIFCTLRGGEFNDAALVFDTATTLGLLSPQEETLLALFLDAELADTTDPLPPPENVTPLLFRLYETLGEPLPTRGLPRAFAVADLRDVAGWKQQIEAAERLARSGALPPNALLGLYTEREPAASGGTWDRVEAVQRFDTALRTGSSEAVSKTLPEAWAAMQSEALEVVFSSLFARDLAAFTLEARAATIAGTMSLLSQDYQTAGLATPDALLKAVAQGNVQGVAVDTPQAQSVALGFGADSARADLVSMAADGRRGEAILRALVLLESGASGDPVSLAAALGTLRALGLEDTMRRAALQVLLLDRYRG